MLLHVHGTVILKRSCNLIIKRFTDQILLLGRKIDALQKLGLTHYTLELYMVISHTYIADYIHCAEFCNNDVYYVHAHLTVTDNCDCVIMCVDTV